MPGMDALLLLQSDAHVIGHQLHNAICVSTQTALFRFLVLVEEILEELLRQELTLE
jgi:hypothetical protein